MFTCFVAGPMTTSGEPGPNLHRAVMLHRELLDHGVYAVVPHLSWIADAIRPTPLHLWRDWNRAMIRASDFVFRMSGKSVGADQEVDFARQIGRPVCRSIDEVAALVERINGRRPSR